ncbi:MAG: ATP-dependent Clp protease ATP-binding subunit [Pirellulales bacterium]|nr:ATP-dependent Clp protease ATP-binding subunit [Pirellulales bacterium]
MRVELPVLVESQKVRDDTRAVWDGLFGSSFTASAVSDQGVASRVFRVRPLFFEGPVAQDRELGRAKSKLVGLLAKQLSTEAKAGNHREVVRYTFSPDLKLHQLKLRLDLRRQTLSARFPVAVFEHLARRLAFSPQLPELWFELCRGQQLEARAAEVYSEHFRKIERRDGEGELQLALQPFTRFQEVWLEYVEFNIDAAQDLRTRQDRFLALLGPAEKVEGATELARVGTCLDHLYPDGLRRFFDGEALVAELDRLLRGKERVPAMVLGPRLVGKTALVHEAVFQRVARRRSPFARKSNVWQLAPQRLISGMMYVGQWEERLLAILKTARRRDHVLYFDDVLGLYHAGLTSNSNLSVADVLKPYVERGDVRIVAEMTPEAWRVFRERDRGFADLFQVLPLEEPPPEDLLPLLLRVVRELERKHPCRFEIDVLPTVLELTRRYQRDLANPGKCAVVLEQLGRKHSGSIGREQVLEDFRGRTGLDGRFLNRYQCLKRREVVEDLRKSIVGQASAVDAMADVVMVAKARLNDPQKPLASMLFLGPTGVGKTQCAKTLARYLFGTEDRLLRFDMNEFVSADSAARLVGAFDRPDGLLTSAVRQQPFAVVLLDEIEKAHPNVFDLLLQIFGDARLSDALGRTVDFSNAIVILTSNLGTREAAAQVGFSGDRHLRHDVYLRAVRDFFRPELFNRLDRIIPFDALSREELGRIARKTLAEVFTREGFVRRHCMLELLPGAEDWVVDRGYEPSLGARAMKRAVEDHVVRPLAVEVAALPKDRPVVVSLRRRGDRLSPKAVALEEAERTPEAARPEATADLESVLRRARTALDRLDQEAVEHRPAGQLAVGAVRPEQELYFHYKEAIAEVRSEVEALRERLRTRWDRHDPPTIAPKQPDFARWRTLEWSKGHSRQVLKEALAAEDIHAYLAELIAQPGPEASTDAARDRLRSVCEWLAWLEAFRPAHGWKHQRALVLLRGLRESESERNALALELGRCGSRPVDLHDADGSDDRSGSFVLCTLLRSQRHGDTPAWWELLAEGPLRDRFRQDLDLTVMGFEGVRAEFILSQTAGTYLFADPHGRMQPVQVEVLPVENHAGYTGVLLEHLLKYDRMTAAAGEEPQGPTGPFSWSPVVALYAASPQSETVYRRVVDFRSGLRAVKQGSLDAWAAMIATLPLPIELRE